MGKLESAKRLEELRKKYEAREKNPAGICHLGKVR